MAPGPVIPAVDSALKHHADEIRWPASMPASQDIETMLSDCGPIKRIDLIKTTDSETGAKHSRGFGFVTFALEADASKAVNTIHGKR